jgi:hypothetical protein
MRLVYGTEKRDVRENNVCVSSHIIKWCWWSIKMWELQVLKNEFFETIHRSFVSRSETSCIEVQCCYSRIT